MRTICKSCRTPFEPTEKQLEMLNLSPHDLGDKVFHYGRGCSACNDTGYKGRVGLHELMIGSDLVKKLIQEHARVAELLATALEDGMLTLKMDGMQKVLQGLTDMHIVRSVCIK